MTGATQSVLPFILTAAIAGCGTATSEKTDAAPGNPAVKGPVTVLAAASTTNALDEIKAKFAGQSDAEVRISYAASSALAQQIARGAEADLFLSADAKWADHVESNAAVAKRRDLLGNRLVIVVPADSKLDLKEPDDLRSAEVQHLALADPEAVPAGRYAKRALTELHLWDGLKGKVAAAEDVRHALTYVETGAAEAGIVYATDAAVSKKVKVVFSIPADLTGPVCYPLLLLRPPADNPAAAAFYDYLGSPEAKRVFEKYGFTVF
jgi:molybdate transport system substrate-binding protein